MSFFFKLTLSVSSLYFFLVVCIGSKSMLSGLDGGHAKLFPLLGGKKGLVMLKMQMQKHFES